MHFQGHKLFYLHPLAVGDMMLTLSMPQFLHLESRDNMSSYLRELLPALNQNTDIVLRIMSHTYIVDAG